MSFKLSRRSLDNLEGVDDALFFVVHRAIEITKVDFGVIEGVRSLDRQKTLLAKGATKTLNSKHLDGRAVDLMAYIGSRASWELSLYDEIAEAVRDAAIEQGTPIRWGAAWHIDDICNWPYTMEAALNDYVDTRRSQDRRPFIDAPHFELA